MKIQLKILREVRKPLPRPTVVIPDKRSKLIDKQHKKEFS